MAETITAATHVHTARENLQRKLHALTQNHRKHGEQWVREHPAPKPKPHQEKPK